jgi:hypothetical protein
MRRLVYVQRWAHPNGISLPVNVKAHFERMLSPPSGDGALGEG